MAQQIRIQMMDHFQIFLDERKTDQLAAKSKKGAAFVQYLIVNEGAPVPNQTLLNALWDDERATNPENALKTLISRLRSVLNQMDPRLGGCIVSDRGAYHWESCPGMTIDLYEIEEILNRLRDESLSDPERCNLYEDLIRLYQGDLLRHADQGEWALSKATPLPPQYMAAV